MKVYKWTTCITAFSSTVSIFLAILLHYLTQSKGSEHIQFWINFCLSVFGSSLLAVVSSILMYLHERERTLKSFMIHTQQLLHELAKYHHDMSLEEKRVFFLDYVDRDKQIWEEDFRSFDFFFGFLNNQKNKSYIHDKIYKPLEQFSLEIVKNIVFLKKNCMKMTFSDSYVEERISELENVLIKYEEGSIIDESDEKGNAIRRTNYVREEHLLTTQINKEFEGRYSRIMHFEKVRCQ